MTTNLTFRVAGTDDDFAQIHRLNYETFAEEIPQHRQNAERMLVDRFHNENTYLIALDGDTVVGMIAARSNRPFSLDAKVDDLDRYLPPHTSVCEFRLLAIRQRYRGGQILPGLMALLDRYCRSHGHDLGIISGTTRQQRLYAHLGFQPFGPLTGSGDARFQPMYLTIDAADREARSLLRLVRPARQPVSFLPGPVEMAEATRTAFTAPPIPHRGAAFATMMGDVRQRLRNLTGASHVLLLNGSGTTANDAIAGQLSLINGYGLVVSNGEFGERLVDHAARFGLRCDVARHAWGQAFDESAIERVALRDRPQWIWITHCETSTGMLNDLTRMKRIANKVGARLVVDCVGSLGTVPLDLGGVFLASGTSGKGLASFAGLGLLFLDHRPRPDTRLPRSLDVGFIAESDSIAFTIPSSPLAALQASLHRTDFAARYATIAADASHIRQTLAAHGIDILVPADRASPAVFTIAVPPDLPVVDVGARLRERGYLVACDSAYLRTRNWLQICLMGDVARERIDAMLQSLTELLPRHPGAIARTPEFRPAR